MKGFKRAWQAALLGTLITAAAAQAPDDEAATRAALADAEARLQAAAEEVARLSRQLAPEAVIVAQSRIDIGGRPRLGLSLAVRETSGQKPTDGITVLGVAPGSPAEAAGVRPGDVLIAFEGESLVGRTASDAVALIGERTADGQPGDSYQLGVRRDDREQTLTATLTEASIAPRVFAFSTDDDFEFDFQLPDMAQFEADVARRMAGREALAGGSVRVAPHGFLFLSSRSPWASMELVELSPRLGQYFDASAGLLVVRAPEDASLGFEDGDVIESIGGREPADVRHGMRILRSYEAGESVDIAIIRDGRRRTLSVRVPEPEPSAPGSDGGFAWGWSSGSDRGDPAGGDAPD